MKIQPKAFMGKIGLFIGVAAFLLGFGCGQNDDGVVGSFESLAPLMEGGDGLDSADLDCRVVLRRAERLPGETGYAVECVEGRCWFVWAAWVDVSEELAAAGARPGVLYQAGADPAWWETREAHEVEGEAGPGFRRFRVLFYENIAGTGTSMTSLMGVRIELSVFAHFDDGSRIFDHNRLTGAFENYVLDSGNNWSVGEAPSVCSEQPVAHSVIRFLPGFVQKQHGSLVKGGRLRVEYSLSRLSECRADINDELAWDVEVYAKFLPGGELYTESVLEPACFENNDCVDGEIQSRPVEFNVPSNAEHVELWFRNSLGDGTGCEAWDSNFGDNYGFPVMQTPPAHPEWAGDWGNGFNRQCDHVDGLAEPMLIDGYIMERACLFVDADVYVPGLTDMEPARPELVAAQVEISWDDGPWETQWLEFQERVGNNYRFRWQPSREELRRVEWTRIRYAFRFSTDGVHWFRMGLDEGPGGGTARTFLRNF